MPTNTYVALDKITLGSNTAFATFTSIPSTYTDLVVVVSGQVSSNVSIACQINGDTGSSYSVTELFGDSGTASSFRNSNNAQITVASIGAQINSGSPWVSTLHFQNYSNTTTNKTILGRTSAAATGVNAIVGLWRSTTAINSIKIMGYANASGFTTGTTFSLYGIKKWTAEETPKATGGYVYSDSTYWYHAFLSSGTFTPNQSLTCDYLVVAGGAGGSYDTGGGGGAGGLRSTVTATGGGGSLESALSVTSQAYTITVGAGGAGALTGSRRGGNGSDSTFSSITSTGGGSGGTAHGGGLDGSTGGSGGGGSRSGGNGGARVVGQGYAGGNGTGGTTGGGGGGGAGSAGTSASTTGGAGGNGVQISSVAFATKTGVNGYYAGGGGGGSNTAPAALGGLGGGGQGGTPGGQNIKPGVNNTGSGGGGCGGGDSTGNANGGSGIVIIRYTK